MCSAKPVCDFCLKLRDTTICVLYSDQTRAQNVAVYAFFAQHGMLQGHVTVPAVQFCRTPEMLMQSPKNKQAKGMLHR